MDRITLGILGIVAGVGAGLLAQRIFSETAAEDTLKRYQRTDSSPVMDAAILGGLAAASWNASKWIDGFPDLKQGFDHALYGGPVKPPSFTHKLVKFGSLGLLGYSAVSTTYNLLADNGHPGEGMRYSNIAGAMGMLGIMTYGAYGSAGYDSYTMISRAFTGIRDKIIDPETGEGRLGTLYSERVEKISARIKKGVFSGDGYFAQSMNSLFSGIASSKFASGTIIGGIVIGLGSYLISGGQSNMITPVEIRQPRRQADFSEYNRNASYAVASYKPRHSYRHSYSDNPDMQYSAPQGLALI